MLAVPAPSVFVFTVTALADPVIRFAPGFDSTGYSLAFSPGIGNTSPVPEPATSGLLALGLGLGLVALLRLVRDRAAAMPRRHGCG